MTSSRRLLIAALTVAALVGAVTFASAASLPLNGGLLASATGTHPCPGGGGAATVPAGSGPTFTAVLLTVPAGCLNKSVRVTLIDGGGVAHSSALTLMTRTTMDIVVPSYTATPTLTVQATVEGWNLPVTWSYTPPVRYGTCEVRSSATRLVVAGLTCEVTDMYITSPWSDGAHRQTHVYVVIQSNQSNGQYLQLTLSLGDARGMPSNWNWGTSGVTSPDGQVVPVSGYQCASLPRLEASTIAGWGGDGAKTYYFGLFDDRTGHSDISCS